MKFRLLSVLLPWMGLSFFLTISEVSAAARDDVLNVLSRAKAGSMEIQSMRDFLEPVDMMKVAALRAALVHEDPYFRMTAAMLLGSVGSDSSKSIAILLKDKEPTVREAAQKALISIGSASVDAVGGIFDDLSPRTEAAKGGVYVLGEIGDSRGAPYLCRLLIRFRKGGFDTRPSYAALAAMKVAAAPHLFRMLRYKDLEEGTYLVLIQYDADGLREKFQDVLRDPAVTVTDRLTYADHAERILGTAKLQDSLSHFYEEILDHESLPIPDRRRLERKLLELLSPKYTMYPMTADEVKRTYKNVRSEEERKEQAEEARKVNELEDARKKNARLRSRIVREEESVRMKNERIEKKAATMAKEQWENKKNNSTRWVKGYDPVKNETYPVVERVDPNSFSSHDEREYIREQKERNRERMESDPYYADP